MDAINQSKTTVEILCFNPRARDGRDTQSRSGCAGTASFNPRARDGRDLMI